jgi:hypothetical protein
MVRAAIAAVRAKGMVAMGHRAARHLERAAKEVLIVHQ